VTLFGLFGKKKALLDRDLGMLTWDGRAGWEGSYRFPPTGTAVAVWLRGPEAGPGPAEKAALGELATRYPALVSAVAAELLELYRPVRADLDVDARAGGAPDPASGADMEALTVLEGVDVDGPAELMLYYAFRPGAGWDDAMFSVRLRDWRPEGRSLDD